MDWGTKDEQEKSNLRFKVAESREENDAGCERVFSINLVSKLASVSSRILTVAKVQEGFCSISPDFVTNLICCYASALTGDIIFH